MAVIYADDDMDAVRKKIQRMENKCIDQLLDATDNIAELEAKKARTWKIFQRGINKKINNAWKDAWAKFDKCNNVVKGFRAYYRENKDSLENREAYYKACVKNGKNCQLSCTDDEEDVSEVDSCEDRCEKMIRKCLKAVNKHNPLE